MALSGIHKDTKFGVGDVVRVHLRVKEKADEKKARLQVFEGTVIGIGGRDIGRTFTVRRIGMQKIGIEQIFPFHSPSVEKVEVTRHGLKGAKQAKLYYVRDKSKREIEKIYARAKKRS